MHSLALTHTITLRAAGGTYSHYRTGMNVRSEPEAVSVCGVSAIIKLLFAKRIVKSACKCHEKCFEGKMVER